jgi:hypothetical protein
MVGLVLLPLLVCAITEGDIIALARTPAVNIKIPPNMVIIDFCLLMSCVLYYELLSVY